MDKSTGVLIFLIIFCIGYIGFLIYMGVKLYNYVEARSLLPCVPAQSTKPVQPVQPAPQIVIQSVEPTQEPQAPHPIHPVVPLSSVPSPTYNQLVGRFIKISKRASGPVNDDRTLNIAEIEIYDDTNQLITNGSGSGSGSGSGPTATSSSNYGGNFPASNLIDHNYNTFGATFGSIYGYYDPEPWFMIDLGSDKVISKIVIYNRTDCCMGRITNSVLTVSNNNNREVFKSGPISNIQTTYTWSGPFINGKLAI